MSIKLREQLWGKMFIVAVLFSLLCLIGMLVACVGLGELPLCKGGELKCYFFVHICGGYAFLNGENRADASTCFWAQKMRCIEGEDGSSSDQLVIPIVSSCLGMLPGIMLIISTIIRNERCLFSLMECGKAFMLMSSTLLVTSILLVDRLTWDCRWYEHVEHGNTDKCRGGYIFFCVGATILLVCQACLLAFLISYEEKHRRKVRSGHLVSVFTIGGAGVTQADEQRTKVKPMRVQVGQGSMQSMRPSGDTPAVRQQQQGMWEDRGIQDRNATGAQVANPSNISTGASITTNAAAGGWTQESPQGIANKDPSPVPEQVMNVKHQAPEFEPEPMHEPEPDPMPMPVQTQPEAQAESFGSATNMEFQNK